MKHLWSQGGTGTAQVPIGDNLPPCYGSRFCHEDSPAGKGTVWLVVSSHLWPKHCVWYLIWQTFIKLPRKNKAPVGTIKRFEPALHGEYLDSWFKIRLHWMDKEVGGRFRMGNTCTPMADSCQCMAKSLQYCEVISFQLKYINWF